MTLERSCSLHVRLLNDANFLQQLAEDNIDISLLNKELCPEKADYGQNPSKRCILNILQCYPVQIIIAFLVLIDAGIVIAEIVLEIHSMKNKIEAYSEQMRGTIHFFNRTFIEGPLLDSSDQHYLEETGSSHNEIDILSRILEILPTSRDFFNLSKHVNCSSFNSPNKLDSDYEAILSSERSHQELTLTKSHRSSNLHQASETLHYASIVILGLFVLEVFLKILCIGSRFFKARFELIDAIVILTSFCADIVIVIVGSQEISVMIIFLLWRIVRVINGLVMHEKQRDELRIFLQKKARRISEMRTEELIIEKEMQEKHCNALEELCLGAGISIDVIDKCRPKLVTPVHKCHTTNPLKSIAALTTGFMGSLVGVHNTSKFIHKFVFHSNSSSPVFSHSNHLSPMNAWNCHKESLAFATTFNQKASLLLPSSPISDDMIARKYVSDSNQSNEPRIRRYRKKGVYKSLNLFNSFNDYPEPYTNYIINTPISSPTILDDWD